MDAAKESDLKIILYDDACHLAPFARNEKRRKHSPATEKMANVKILVDKMHFAGHVGEWCMQNCNPYKEPDLANVNTQICEQSFRWMNSFRQVCTIFVNLVLVV
jgi:hypothetical protein